MANHSCLALPNCTIWTQSSAPPMVAHSAITNISISSWCRVRLTRAGPAHAVSVPTGWFPCFRSSNIYGLTMKQLLFLRFGSGCSDVCYQIRCDCPVSRSRSAAGVRRYSAMRSQHPLLEGGGVEAPRFATGFAWRVIPFICTANGVIDLCLADLPRIEPVVVTSGHNSGGWLRAPTGQTYR